MQIDDIHANFLGNGKFVIEWIMRHCIYKGSTIPNNLSERSIEQSSPRYILNLFLSAITVNVKSADIMNSLPALEF
jgi:predicted helicase